MTGSTDHNELMDARLVAYLDGVLDESERLSVARDLADNHDLVQRLGELERGGRDFRQAFDPLLDAAPEARLHTMLAGLIVEQQPEESDRAPGDNVVPMRPGSRSIWRAMGSMAAAAGIALVVFSGGVYTGWQTGDKPVVQQKKIGWRQAAAQYVALFNRQTLQGYSRDTAAQDERLRQVSKALGLSVTRERAIIDKLAFKGTQILQLNGKPLVQIAYLHKDKTPVALCIIKSKKPSSRQKTETRLGLHIVHWIEGGYGYMLIGKVPKTELQEIAAPLVAHWG